MSQTLPQWPVANPYLHTGDDRFRYLDRATQEDHTDKSRNDVNISQFLGANVLGSATYSTAEDILRAKKGWLVDRKGVPLDIDSFSKLELSHLSRQLPAYYSSLKDNANYTKNAFWVLSSNHVYRSDVDAQKLFFYQVTHYPKLYTFPQISRLFPESKNYQHPAGNIKEWKDWKGNTPSELTAFGGKYTDASVHEFTTKFGIPDFNSDEMGVGKQISKDKSALCKRAALLYNVQRPRTNATISQTGHNLCLFSDDVARCPVQGCLSTGKQGQTFDNLEDYITNNIFSDVKLYGFDDQENEVYTWLQRHRFNIDKDPEIVGQGQPIFDAITIDATFSKLYNLYQIKTHTYLKYEPPVMSFFRRLLRFDKHFDCSFPDVAGNFQAYLNTLKPRDKPKINWRLLCGKQAAFFAYKLHQEFNKTVFLDVKTAILRLQITDRDMHMAALGNKTDFYVDYTAAGSLKPSESVHQGNKHAHRPGENMYNGPDSVCTLWGKRPYFWKPLVYLETSKRSFNWLPRFLEELSTFSEGSDQRKLLKDIALWVAMRSTEHIVGFGNVKTLNLLNLIFKIVPSMVPAVREWMVTSNFSIIAFGQELLNQAFKFVAQWGVAQIADSQWKQIVAWHMFQWFFPQYYANCHVDPIHWLGANQSAVATTWYRLFYLIFQAFALIAFTMGQVSDVPAPGEVTIDGNDLFVTADHQMHKIAYPALHRGTTVFSPEDDSNLFKKMDENDNILTCTSAHLTEKSSETNTDVTLHFTATTKHAPSDGTTCSFVEVLGEQDTDKIGNICVLGSAAGSTASVKYDQLHFTGYTTGHYQDFVGATSMKEFILPKNQTFYSLQGYVQHDTTRQNFTTTPWYVGPAIITHDELPDGAVNNESHDDRQTDAKNDDGKGPVLITHDDLPDGEDVGTGSQSRINFWELNKSDSSDSSSDSSGAPSAAPSTGDTNGNSTGSSGDPSSSPTSSDASAAPSTAPSTGDTNGNSTGSSGDPSSTPTSSDSSSDSSGAPSAAPSTGDTNGNSTGSSGDPSSSPTSSDSSSAPSAAPSTGGTNGSSTGSSGDPSSTSTSSDSSSDSSGAPSAAPSTGDTNGSSTGSSGDPSSSPTSNNSSSAPSAAPSTGGTNGSSTGSSGNPSSTPTSSDSSGTPSGAPSTAPSAGGTNGSSTGSSGTGNNSDQQQGQNFFEQLMGKFDLPSLSWPFKKVTTGGYTMTGNDDKVITFVGNKFQASKVLKTREDFKATTLLVKEDFINTSHANYSAMQIVGALHTQPMKLDSKTVGEGGKYLYIRTSYLDTFQTIYNNLETTLDGTTPQEIFAASREVNRTPNQQEIMSRLKSATSYYLFMKNMQLGTFDGIGIPVTDDEPASMCVNFFRWFFVNLNAKSNITAVSTLAYHLYYLYHMYSRRGGANAGEVYRYRRNYHRALMTILDRTAETATGDLDTLLMQKTSLYLFDEDKARGNNAYGFF